MLYSNLSFISLSVCSGIFFIEKSFSGDYYNRHWKNRNNRINIIQSGEKMLTILRMIIAMSLLSNTVWALETQKLPNPAKEGGMPLMQTLNERKTIRRFDNKAVDNQTLSEILWAAYGVNRDNGLRTIPTARNQKDLDVYVFSADGIWLYEAEKHALLPVSDKNMLSLFATQDFMQDVPLVLVYAGSRNQDYPVMHAGSAYQNVGLYAASKGMANVVRGYFDKESVNRALELPEDKTVIVSQAIGWPKQGD